MTEVSSVRVKFKFASVFSAPCPTEFVCVCSARAHARQVAGGGNITVERTSSSSGAHDRRITRAAAASAAAAAAAAGAAAGGGSGSGARQRIEQGETGNNDSEGKAVRPVCAHD
jgi:hypothetical protein